MSGSRPYRNRPSMGWLRAGHAPPLLGCGNEVSDNLFRIGCLQNRDPRADADRPGDGHADADKRHGAESGRGRPHERVADAGQPVRHGGGAGLWLRLPRPGGAQPAHRPEPPCVLRRKARAALRPAAARRAVGDRAAWRLHGGRGRAARAVCEHQGL